MELNLTRVLSEQHERILWVAGCLLSALLGAGIMNGVATYDAVHQAWQQCNHIVKQIHLQDQGYAPNPKGK